MGWFAYSSGGLGNFDGSRHIVDFAKGKEIVQKFEIPDGEAGTDATVHIMANLAMEGAKDPRMVTLAQSIVNGTGSKNYREELEKIFDYVKRNIRYRRDPLGMEWVQTPYYTMFVRGEADCDDCSVLLTCLSLCLGQGAAFKAVKGDPSRPQDFSHIFAVLGCVDRTSPSGVLWLPADATQGIDTPLGWEPPKDKLFGSKTWLVANP